MRASTFILAAALTLPGLGAVAQTASIGSGGSDTITEMFKSRGAPTGRVGGATRGINKEALEAQQPSATRPATRPTTRVANNGNR
jgi:hypothetical protein